MVRLMAPKHNDHPDLRPLWDEINALEIQRIHHRNEEARIEREIGQKVQEVLAKRKKLFPGKSPSPYAKENRCAKKDRPRYLSILRRRNRIRK